MTKVLTAWWEFVEIRRTWTQATGTKHILHYYNTTDTQLNLTI